MAKRLAAEQVEQYWERGFTVVRGLFAPAELAPWLARTRALARGDVDAPQGMKLVRDVMVAKGVVQPTTREHEICKINFFENDPVLRTYGEHPALLDCVEDVLGEDLLLVNSMCVTKPPGVDGRHPLHQDLLYFGFRPGDAMVGTWTALEPATRENGCLSVVPGSHRGELYEHGVPEWDWVNAGFVGAKGALERGERLHVEMDAGDALLFHSLLLHGSGTNRSQRFRRAISTHYARTGCEDLWEGVDRMASRPWIPVRGAGAPPVAG